jgi:hypothetical protein
VTNESHSRQVVSLFRGLPRCSYPTFRSALYTTNIVRINYCIKKPRIVFASTGFTIPDALVHIMLRYSRILFTECIRTITGSPILCRVLHHIGSNRIHLNIPATGQKVALRINDTGLVSPYTQRPCPEIFFVNVLNLAPTYGLNYKTDGLFR